MGPRRACPPVRAASPGVQHIPDAPIRAWGSDPLEQQVGVWLGPQLPRGRKLQCVCGAQPWPSPQGDSGVRARGLLGASWARTEGRPDRGPQERTGRAPSAWAPFMSAGEAGRTQAVSAAPLAWDFYGRVGAVPLGVLEWEAVTQQSLCSQVGLLRLLAAVPSPWSFPSGCALVAVTPRVQGHHRLTSSPPTGRGTRAQSTRVPAGVRLVLRGQSSERRAPPERRGVRRRWGGMRVVRCSLGAGDLVCVPAALGHLSEVRGGLGGSWGSGRPSHQGQVSSAVLRDAAPGVPAGGHRHHPVFRLH